MTERKQISILMAEDDDDYYLLAEEAFRDFRVLNKLNRVSDGEELMEYLLHQGKYQKKEDFPRPGLILLDLNMPKKNGHAALREIRQHPELCRIPIIILTISRDKKDIQQSYALGANSFMTKPLNFNQLVETLKVFNQYWFEIVEIPS